MPTDKEGGPSAAEIIRLLDLRPHPEAGIFGKPSEIPRKARRAGPPRRSSIFFSMRARPRNGTEWTPLRPGIFTPARPCRSASRAMARRRVDISSAMIFRGQRPQFVVPAHCGRRVEPRRLDARWLQRRAGFEFSGFDLAPPGWRPGSAPG